MTTLYASSFYEIVKIAATTKKDAPFLPTIQETPLITGPLVSRIVPGAVRAGVQCSATSLISVP